MDIKRSGSQPSVKGPLEWFTGRVRIDPLFQAPDPVLVQGASITFEPGARSVRRTIRKGPASTGSNPNIADEFSVPTSSVSPGCARS